MTSPHSGAPRYGLPPEPGVPSWEDAAPIPRSPVTPEYPARYAHPEPSRPESSRRRTSNWAVFGRLCALVYLLMIGVAVLLPDPAAIHVIKLNVAHIVQKVASHIAHMPAITVGDISSNIAAFIPLTLLLALGWRRAPLWVCGVAGMVFSTAGEVMQYLFPDVHRRPDIWNVVENSIGAWIGVAIAAVIFQLIGRTDASDR